MKNLRIKSAVLAIAAICTIGLVSTYAQRGEGHGRDSKRGMMGDKIAKELNLTEDQRIRIKAIWDSFKAENKTAHEQIRTNRQQLKEMNDNGTYSREKAEQLIKQNADFQAKIKLAMLDKQQQIKTILTADQQAKFKELREKRHEKMKGRHGKRHGDKMKNQNSDRIPNAK